MTDARFPERWLNDRRVLRLSDAGFRLYFTALAWSVSNRTDGFIDKDDLSMMLRVDTGHVTELEEASLWSRDADRWLIVDFAGTQTSSTQLAGLDVKRMQDRERAKNYRDRKKSSRDSSRDDKGQARTGQDRTKNLDEGEVFGGPSHDVPKAEPEMVLASGPSLRSCPDCGNRVASAEHEIACVNRNVPAADLAAFTNYSVDVVEQVRANAANPMSKPNDTAWSLLAPGYDN